MAGMFWSPCWRAAMLTFSGLVRLFMQQGLPFVFVTCKNESKDTWKSMIESPTPGRGSFQFERIYFYQFWKSNALVEINGYLIFHHHLEISSTVPLQHVYIELVPWCFHIVFFALIFYPAFYCFYNRIIWNKRTICSAYLIFFFFNLGNIYFCCFILKNDVRHRYFLCVYSKQINK